MSVAAPTRRAPSPIASGLAAAPLVRSGGATVIDLLDDSALAGLRSEVASRWHAATTADRTSSNDTARGDPDRSLAHIDAGRALDDLYASTGLATTLHALTGIGWRPLGAHASYSVYAGRHHLGPHRDIVGCDLTVIVVVHDDTPCGQPLWLWPARARDGIDAIRRDPETARRGLVARPGQAVVLLGEIIPHQLPPMPDGAIRVVAPLCFTPDVTRRRTHDDAR